MTVTPEERETIVRFDDASDRCEIWTANSTVAARLKRSGVVVTKDGGGWRCEVVK